jgi:DNA-binding transcriptional MocR family regulator
MEEKNLYRKIASNIEHKIVCEVFQTGDKLPSIRQICREHSVSMSTALEAYYFLEGKGFIESRPKSGYYVCDDPFRKMQLPSKSNPSNQTDEGVTEALVNKVYSSFHSDTTVLFSVGVPSAKYLPVAKLNKGLLKAMHELPGSGTEYEKVQGNERLRKQIARLSLHWDGRLTTDDIVITSGCMEAICLALITTTQHGDSIVVESPAYFGILQLAKSLGLNVIELPTDPQTGIDMSSLKKATRSAKVKAIILMSNFSNPLGCMVTSENKKEIVQLIEKRGIYLIEDDIYGDLYFGTQRPKCCKSFDESGRVLWCGSVSKTLAPGYRVGWIAPGILKEKIIRQKLFNSVSSPTLTQQIVATFLESGRYENHLRKLRGTLHANSLKMSRLIGENFPPGTRISRPQGGFMLWIELENSYNSVSILDEALKNNICIAPGRMFTLQEQYQNCMRLSYGLEWNSEIEQALVKLGNIIKKQNILVNS